MDLTYNYIEQVKLDGIQATQQELLRATGLSLHDFRRFQALDELTSSAEADK